MTIPAHQQVALHSKVAAYMDAAGTHKGAAPADHLSKIGAFFDALIRELQHPELAPLIPIAIETVRDVINQKKKARTAKQPGPKSKRSK